MTNIRNITVEKITLNIGTGKPGPGLEKATKLLQTITGSKPVETKTKKRIPTWEIRPGLPIGCKVTLRKKKALELLPKLLSAVENKLDPSKFDKEGNFAFGIKEYIDISGAKYDSSIGIIGLEVAVTLQRPGYRIKRRKLAKRKIKKRHSITKEEAIEFVAKNFGVKIGG